jgi:5-bromo-4-chloroindolyl phosphate hydrolysis protein
MRSVIIALALMLCVVTGGGMYTSTLLNVSDELSELNSSVRDSLYRDNIEGARSGITQMKDYLSKKESILSAMGNHEDIDKIKINMAELEIYTLCDEIPDALAKSEVLEFLFSHLPENYRLKPENIM